MTTTATPRVLVVDDEENIRFLVGSALQIAGFDTAVAESGREADGELAADQIFTLLQGVNVLSCAGIDGRQLRRLLRRTVQTTLQPTVSLP